MNSGVILGPEGTLMTSSWRCERNFRLVPPMSTPRMFIEPPRDVLRQAGPDGLVLHASIYTCAWQTSREGVGVAAQCAGGVVGGGTRNGFGTSVEEWLPFSRLQIANSASACFARPR